MSKSCIAKVAVILLLLFFSFGCIDPDPPEDVIRFTVVVTDSSIDIPTGQGLDFGGVPRGSRTEKIIGFDGHGDMNLRCDGEISDWVTMSPSAFHLSEHQNVTVSITVPADAEMRRYDGVLVQTFK